MKTKFGLMLLAIAGTVGSVGLAQAQPPPPAAPPPAPPPPAAEFGVAPAALPSAPVQVAPPPVVSFGNAPPGDSTSPGAEPEKKPNPFRFTRFTWGNTGSAHLFGVGGVQGGEGDQYNMDFSLSLRYYVLDKPNDTLYVGAGLGWTVELTNSDTTQNKHEPLFKDMTLSTGYGHTVFTSANKENKSTPIVGLSAALPTSQASRAQGKYLGTNLTAGWVQTLGLAGAKSDWFSDVLMFGTVTWSHLFSKGYDALTTAPAATTRIRTAPDGRDTTTDQLGFSSFAIDTAKLNFTYYLTLYKDLSLGNTWEIDFPAKHSFKATGITLPTGTAPIAASNWYMIPSTTFDVSLSYLLFETVRLDLGYSNTTSEIAGSSTTTNGSGAPSGNPGATIGRRSVFYTPEGAQFYGNVAIYLDNIIDRAIKPKKSTRTASARNPFSY